MALCNPLREYLISSLSLSYSLISVFSLFPAQTRSLPVSPYFSPSSFLSSCCETSLLASPRDVGLLLVSLRAEYKMEKKKIMLSMQTAANCISPSLCQQE